MQYDNYENHKYRGKKNNGRASKRPIRLTFLQLVFIVISCATLGYCSKDVTGSNNIQERSRPEQNYPTPTPVQTPEYEETPYPEVTPTP